MNILIFKETSSYIKKVLKHRKSALSSHRVKKKGWGQENKQAKIANRLSRSTLKSSFLQSVKTQDSGRFTLALRSKTSSS